MALADVFRSFCLLFLTPACYDKFFIEFNFLHAPCLKAAVSKGLGLGIVAGSVLVKVPQIVKMVKARSGQGINITGTTLELAALSFSFAYSFVNGYPFSSYGDGGFLLLQTTVVGSLVFLYAGSTPKASTFSLAVLSSVTLLCSGLVPLRVLWFLQATNIPFVFAGKMMQAASNYKSGHTGQLSAITAAMLFFGSLARIFTSIQETGDPIIILTYSVSSLANGIIMGQILYYWNVIPKAKED